MGPGLASLRNRGTVHEGSFKAGSSFGSSGAACHISWRPHVPGGAIGGPRRSTPPAPRGWNAAAHTAAMVDTTHELGGGGTRHTSGTGRANGGRVDVWARSRMCVWVCVGGGVWLCKGIARVFTHATFCWVERDEDGATQLYRTTTPNTSPIPAIRPALLARPVPQPILPGRPLPPRLAAPHNTVHHFDGDVNEHEGRHTYVL